MPRGMIECLRCNGAQWLGIPCGNECHECGPSYTYETCGMCNGTGFVPECLPELYRIWEGWCRRRENWLREARQRQQYDLPLPKSTFARLAHLLFGLCFYTG